MSGIDTLHTLVGYVGPPFACHFSTFDDVLGMGEAWRRACHCHLKSSQ